MLPDTHIEITIRFGRQFSFIVEASLCVFTFARAAVSNVMFPSTFHCEVVLSYQHRRVLRILLRIEISACIEWSKVNVWDAGNWRPTWIVALDKSDQDYCNYGIEARKWGPSQITTQSGTIKWLDCWWGAVNYSHLRYSPFWQEFISFVMPKCSFAWKSDSPEKYSMICAQLICLIKMFRGGEPLSTKIQISSS